MKMNLDKLIFEMYEDIMFSIENNLFEERLSSKESFRRAIALWKNINPAKKEVEAKRILKAAKREGYTVKQKEILAYADEDISSMKAKKSVRRDLRAKKKAKRDERFEQVKASVEEKDIEDKTRIELLAIAVKKGLKTTPKMNRADLIDLIQGDEKRSKKYSEKIELLKKQYDELNNNHIRNLTFVSGGNLTKSSRDKISNWQEEKYKLYIKIKKLQVMQKIENKIPFNYRELENIRLLFPEYSMFYKMDIAATSVYGIRNMIMKFLNKKTSKNLNIYVEDVYGEIKYSY
jgi:hypothetical protein